MPDPIEEELLSVIVARPDDEWPRRVYADYLADRGDPRAELIRVQLALAERIRTLVPHSVPDDRGSWFNPYVAFEEEEAGPADDQDRRLYSRFRSLVEFFTDEMIPAEGRRLEQVAVDGGMVCGLQGKLAAVASLPRDWMARTPLQELRLTWIGGGDRVEGWLEEVLRAAAWRRLAIGGHIHFRGARQIVESLTSGTGPLHLTLAETALTSRGLAEIVGGPLRPRLASLVVHDATVGPEALDVLLGTGRRMERLAWLDLSGTTIGDDGVARLAEWPGLQHVRHLGLADLPVSVSTWDRLLASPFRRSDLSVRVDTAMRTTLRRAGLAGAATVTVGEWPARYGFWMPVLAPPVTRP